MPSNNLSQAECNSQKQKTLKKGKIRPLRKCASPRVPVWVALKDSPPFATMLLLPPHQLVVRVLGRETVSEVMGSCISGCKVTAVPNTPHHQAVPLQVW